MDPSVHLQGEGTGEAHREGSRGRATQARLLDPFGGGINIGTGSTEIPFGDQPRTQIPFKPGFSTANIGGTLTFPEQTKAGSGKVRAEQDITFRVPFLGKCIKLGVGTSDTTTVEVLPARFDSTVITDLGVTAARQAQPVTLRWKLSRGGRARVTLYYLFTKNQSVPVSKLFDGQRSAGANDHTFPMSFDGKALPAGATGSPLELEDQAGATNGPQAGQVDPARPKNHRLRHGVRPVRVRVASAALLAVTLLPAAAEGRTTDLFAFANKEDRPAGYLLRGDKIHVIAHRFIPKAVCKPKVRFTLTDSAGTKFKVGSAHPSFGDFGEGAMNRDLERVPAAAKPGKATIRSKQKCRLGSASGKDGIRIIDPGQPKPRVTQTGALDVLSGNKTTLAFQVDRYAYANVVVEWSSSRASGG